MTAQLRLMATTDVHAALMPFDYVRDVPDPIHGLAKCARVIRQAQAEVPGHLLFDCGDAFEGTALADLLARPRPDGPKANGTHLVVSVMNALGYDAMALGNHDFNYGLPALRRALGAAAFPALCANLVARGTAQTAFPGTAILQAKVKDDTHRWHTCRVGIFGVLPPQTVAWDRHHLGQTHWVLPIVETARRRAKALRAAGAEVVVALAHTGIPSSSNGLETGPFAENAALEVAAIEAVDVVFCGHTHGKLPGPQYAPLEPAVAGFDATRGLVGDTPIVMSGSAGCCLGVVDLTLARQGGRWRIAKARSELREFSPASPTNDPVVNTIAQAHQQTRGALNAQVGHTDVPLHTLFALAKGSRVSDLIAHVQKDFAQTQIAALPDARDLPLLSAGTAFRAVNSGNPNAVTEILPGQVLRRHLYDIYPFPNAFALVEVTGAQLQDWVLQSAQIFAQITPGAGEQPLLRKGVPSYSFDTLHGAETVLDLQYCTNDPRRIAALRIDGRAIALNDRLLVATNTYRAGLLSAKGQLVRILPTLTPYTRDLVEAAFAKGLAWSGRPLDRPWSLAPIAGASAQFRTSPLAWTYSEEARRLDITLGGYDAEGYLQASLSL